MTKAAAYGLVPVLALLTACPAAPAPKADEGVPERAAAAAERERGPEFVLAPERGAVVDIVNAERERAKADGRRLIVYVGASWCEPCQYFHAAVDDGRLDEVFPDLRLLEFDLDHDRDRLREAGYESRMIPLFAVPGPDGRAGPRRMEGGIKGPEAVEQLRGRLEALLHAAAADSN